MYVSLPDVHVYVSMLNSTVVVTAVVVVCAFVLVCGMAAPPPTWSCPSCGIQVTAGHKYCTECTDHPMLHVKCSATGWKGRYTDWHTRHRTECDVCSPELALKIKHERESKAILKHKHLLDTTNGTFHPPSCACVLQR